MIYVWDFIKNHYGDNLSSAMSALLCITRKFPKELNYPNNGRRLTGDDILRLMDHKSDAELLEVRGLGQKRLEFLRQLQWDIRRAS